MTEELSIRQKIERGDYTSKLEYPRPVPKPDLFRKKAEDMTALDIASLPGIKAKYDDDLQHNRLMQEAAKCDARLMIDRFRVDLLDDNGVDQDSEFADLLWSKAWEDGHRSSLSDVVCCFEELMPFYHAAQAMVEKALHDRTGSTL